MRSRGGERVLHQNLVLCPVIVSGRVNLPTPDAAFGHEILNVPIAEAGADIQPHTVADNLRGEAMALIGIEWRKWVHAAGMPGGAGARQAAKLI
jgi:hypothetical protein